MKAKVDYSTTTLTAGVALGLGRVLLGYLLAWGTEVITLGAQLVCELI